MHPMVDSSKSYLNDQNHPRLLLSAQNMASKELISIAPMIGWTDRHYRYLFRHISRCPTLYTEMVMDTAILYNTDKLEDFIGYNREIEPPLTLQLGGNKPDTLAKAVEVCEQFGGFNEINLNCGCPSNKAKRCGFGAELMLDPELVRKITYEMKRRASHTDITVKCRIGTNLHDTWGDLLDFVHACRDSGIRKMVIHARICILCGLSPAQNRNIPPLRYDIVSRLVDTFPEMTFVLNGGVRTYNDIDHLLGHTSHDSATADASTTHTAYGGGAVLKQEYDLREKLSVPLTLSGASRLHIPPSVFRAPPTPANPTDTFLDTENIVAPGMSEQTLPPMTQLPLSPVHGVMVGREAYNNPWAWATADSYYYHKHDPAYTRGEALERYLAYAEPVLHSGAPRSSVPYLCKPLHNFFSGCATNKHYKRKLDHLLKVHVAHGEKGHRGHVVSREGSGALSFEDIVRQAVQDTIPESFLDSRQGGADAVDIDATED